ncbi:MAG TPA: hypothetical protein VMS74_14430 [Acidimicrobiia bacterium]|nr:hypothetical protein [Acidimicrobiia bacterium]
MLNFRRVVASLATGFLLLVAVAAQAGAAEIDGAHLAIAERGFVTGLGAAERLTADAEDGGVHGAGIAHALSVLETVMARFEERLGGASENGKGRGPERALEVHRALLAGELPSVAGRGGGSIPGLARAYGHMRSQLDDAVGRGPAAGPKKPPVGPSP